MKITSSERKSLVDYSLLVTHYSSLVSIWSRTCRDCVASVVEIEIESESEQWNTNTRACSMYYGGRPLVGHLVCA